jgi:hypothetical protein
VTGTTAIDEVAQRRDRYARGAPDPDDLDVARRDQLVELRPPEAEQTRSLGDGDEQRLTGGGNFLHASG